MPIRLIALAALAAAVLPLAAQIKPIADPAWKTAIEARRQQLVKQNGYGTDSTLRTQLMQMRSTDQAARGFAPATATKHEMMQKLPVTDAQLTDELKQIVKTKGWPTIAMVGIDASNAAMLILTHTADHAWQRQMLPQLEQLADAGKIDPSSLAFVVDKELVAEGKLQRYGTQFKYIDGGLAMYGVEDPGSLDHQRARALLPPIDVYKQQLTQMYHVPASKEIVSAAAPAKN